MKTIKYMFLFMGFLLCFYACKEQKRFEIGYSDIEAPSAPEYIDYKPLYGGARLFYNIPSDKDLLSIDASYINTLGREVWFSVSYFKDSLDVYGFNDTLEHVINLYAVDRAGNKSEIVPVTVTPLEPALTRVAKSLFVKPGFASFFMDWKNELKQNINVYVDFTYTEKGQYKEQQLIYTSNDTAVRWFIRDLELTSQEPVSIKVRVEDPYGNITESIDKGQITLLEDELIPKDKWTMPENDGLSVVDSVGGIPMAFLSAYEGKAQYVIDGVFETDVNWSNANFIHTGGRGRTGRGVNVPYNIMINLGDEYEISRIVTHQRCSDGDGVRGSYYRGENVGLYAMYIWNELDQAWDSISQHKILIPVGMTDMEYKQLGLSGDMAYLYPDDPQFSRATRWFRYEALAAFGGNYTSTGCNCLSEITLYGRKKK
ncbi:MAG: DUF4959 domain-containing protein [Prevotellaceae bacterium]|jgi:hypothetical protein|nr:DUF4959 domain-containing protein [Prevotellaceae bacterium]